MLKSLKSNIALFILSFEIGHEYEVIDLRYKFFYNFFLDNCLDLTNLSLNHNIENYRYLNNNLKRRLPS